MLTLKPMGNLESPVCPPCMPFGLWGRKLGSLETMWKICRILTERRFGPGIFLMWGDYANHCTTMASSSFLLHMKYLDIEKTAWAGSPLSPPLPTPLHSTAFYSADDLMVYLNQLDDKLICISYFDFFMPANEYGTSILPCLFLPTSCGSHRPLSPVK